MNDGLAGASPRPVTVKDRTVDQGNELAVWAKLRAFHSPEISAIRQAAHLVIRARGNAVRIPYS